MAMNMELLFKGKCRTCLGVLSDSGTNVTQVQSEIISKSVSDLSNCVSPQDVICNACVKCLNEFYYFIKKLKEVDEELKKNNLNTNNLKDFLECFSNDILNLDSLNNFDNDHSYFTLPEEETNDHSILEKTQVNKLAPKIEINEILNRVTNDHSYQNKKGWSFSCKEETNIKLDVDRAVSLQLQENKMVELINELQKDGVLVNNLSSTTPGKKRIILLGGGMHISYRKCFGCQKLFRNKEQLIKHEEVCRQKMVTCTLCKENFNKQSLFNNHMRQKHRYCTKCREYFMDEYDYNSHINVCTRIFQCKMCGLKFSKLNELTHHQSEVHNKQSQEVPGLCDICGKKFEKKSALTAHKKSHTGEQQCTLCEKVLKNECGLKAHVKNVHRKRPPQQCDHCGFMCRTSTLLKRHLVRHEKNRIPKYCCQGCDKKFFTSCGLYNHRKRHHDQGKIFACEYCDKSYHRKDYLRLHTKKHFTPCSRKAHDLEICHCPICKKEFRYAHHLREHMKIHDFKPRRFKCNFCNLQFYVKRNMQTHEKNAHTGRYRYRCNICFIKKFETEKELLHHENSHNRTKKYVCAICKEAFARNFLLSNHILHDHGVMMNNDGDVINPKILETRQATHSLQIIEDTKNQENENKQEIIHYFVNEKKLNDLTVEYS